MSKPTKSEYLYLLRREAALTRKPIVNDFTVDDQPKSRSELWREHRQEQRQEVADRRIVAAEDQGPEQQRDPGDRGGVIGSKEGDFPAATKIHTSSFIDRR